MPNAGLRGALIELGWSLWTELGVSGWGGRHASWLVDPEPLIIFTAWLGDDDARLRDESTDWCVRFAPLVSATRLANLEERASDATRERLHKLAAIVSTHSSVRWNVGTTRTALAGSAGDRPSFVPTNRSRLESLGGASRLSLRLRAILGVGARAEIVRVLLEPSGPARSSADLADETAFKKRYLASSLEMMQKGGVVDGEKVRKEIRFRLDRVNAWHDLVGETPTVWPRWIHILPLLTAVADVLERTERLSPRVQAVEVHAAVESLLPLLKKARLRTTPEGISAEGLRSWFENVAFELAHANAGAFDPAAL